MNWLTPQIGLIAAAITVPTLVLLYFLKLKRRVNIVSSTLLWQRAVQDLQVNAPFQRLRKNLLLLLQLLILAAILTALAGPMLTSGGKQAKRYVLLIDKSASMNSLEGQKNRLDMAKQQAKDFVASLQEKQSFFAKKDARSEIMVIALDSRAKVMCNFTTNNSQLTAAIESIKPSDGTTELSQAITVAQAFAQSPGVEANGRSAETPPQLELFTDGKISDLADVRLAGADLNLHAIGETDDNVAVIAMQARRSLEKAEEVNVFAALANYGPEAVNCDIQLSVNGDIHAIRKIAIPGATLEEKTLQKKPGKSSVSFAITGVDAGVVEIRQMRKDALASDDAAWSIIAKPKKLSVLLVSNGNTILKSALQSCPLAELTESTPENFSNMDLAEMNIKRPYDVIVLDGYAPDILPRCSYLVLNTVPKNLGISVTDELENQFVVDWRERHPVLENANLANLFASKCNKLTLPRDAEVLCEFDDTPALVLLRRNNNLFLLTSFDIMETSWPFDVGFVMFCYNSIAYLGSESIQTQQHSLAIGQPITTQYFGNLEKAIIDGPNISKTPITKDSSNILRFPDTSKAGVYTLTINDELNELFAVNMLDTYESDITPMKEIKITGTTVTAKENKPGLTQLALWPFLVMAALIVVCIEWFVYNSRVRL